MGLILWSPPELAGFGVGEGTGSLGTGVELRLTDQGLIESTAEAQVDLSVFLSAGTVAMLSSARYCHAREAPRENLLLVETRSSCLTTTRLKVATSGLLGDANVENGERRIWLYFAMQLRERAASCVTGIQSWARLSRLRSRRTGRSERQHEFASGEQEWAVAKSK